MNKLKISVLLLSLCFAAPAYAAQAQSEGKAAISDTKTAKPAPEANTGTLENKVEKVVPGEYSCKYYKVKLPDDWKAIMPPTDKQGTVNAIFATNSGSSVVTIIIGPSGGADAKTIAGMFAEQFKAPNAPVEKNGLFTFGFPMQNATAQAYVATKDKDFMVITISGANIKQAKNFIKNSIKSDTWGNLLPQ